MVKIISQTETEAIFRGELTYYSGEDCLPYQYMFDYLMVYSREENRWQIDSMIVP